MKTGRIILVKKRDEIYFHINRDIVSLESFSMDVSVWWSFPYALKVLSKSRNLAYSRNGLQNENS